MVTISAIKTELLLNLVVPLFSISFIMLALVPIVGVEVKGAQRWIDVYFFRLQPIEILKPFFILITVKILTIEKFKNTQIKYFLSFIILSSVIIFKYKSVSNFSSRSGHLVSSTRGQNAHLLLQVP